MTTKKSGGFIRSPRIIQWGGGDDAMKHFDSYLKDQIFPTFESSSET